MYVLDEPSAGLHPADTEALLRALDRLKAAGNSLFVVEHELDVIRHADWIVDVGPGAGEHGGQVLYSGPPDGLRQVAESRTRRYLSPAHGAAPRAPRPAGRLAAAGRRHAEQPAGPRRRLPARGAHDRDRRVRVGQVEPGQPGAGGAGRQAPRPARHGGDEEDETPELERDVLAPTGGRIVGGAEAIERLVVVDQKPIGRTPRSNLATYTGLFDHVRKLFAATKAARARRYDAGRFSFNVAKGRCETCAGEGFVMVELLFLPSVYAPCPACHGARYNARDAGDRATGARTSPTCWG